MAINASTSGGGNFELTPAGTHVARCIRMVHLGTIEEEFQGDKKLMNKVQIAFELPHELRVFEESKGEQPMCISKKYTISLGEKANLRKDLESWRGKAFSDEEVKGFDITRLVSVPCMLSIIHKESKGGNIYAAIAGISGLPKGTVCPDQINPSFVFEWDNFDQEKFDSLHEKTREILMGSLEYKKMIGDMSGQKLPDIQKPSEIEDDLLPF